MPPKILVVSPSAEVGDIAREMAPGGFETVIVRDSEVVGVAAEPEYMVCYPQRADATTRSTRPRRS